MGYRHMGEEISNLVAKTDLLKGRNVTIDSTGAVVYTTAAKRGLGILNDDTKAGEACFIQTTNIDKPIAGGTIAIGVEVEVGADGKHVTIASGVAVGIALSAGVADKEFQLFIY